MDVQWFVERCRAAGENLRAEGDTQGAAALRALANEIEAESAQLDAEERTRLRTTGSTAPAHADGSTT